MDSSEILDIVVLIVVFIRSKLIRVVWVIHFWLPNKTLFVWLHPLTRPYNNPINIFLIKRNIISYHVLFIKYLWISETSLVSKGLKSTEKNLTTPYNPGVSYYWLWNLLKYYFDLVPSLLFQSFLFWTDILL